MQLSNQPVDPFVVAMIVCIFGCLLSPLLVAVEYSVGSYHAVEYTFLLQMALGSVALFYVLAQVYIAQLYYLVKASWTRVALNLQVLITFFFDITVAGV